MTLSNRLRSLGHSIKLAGRILKARLEKTKTAPRVSPMAGGVSIFDDFGENPGRLRMLAHVPSLAKGQPLVVLLHGCGQDAVGFAKDSGWVERADRLGFPLILPEQAQANNSGRCFQWFNPSDTSRGQGEAASIAAMTRAAIGRFGCDPRRIFVVGLSAGGAMAAALLAAYPDLFAAGASVAGLPVGAARSGMQAMMRMAVAGPLRSPEAWAEQVRAVAPAGFTGPWPRLSVWQGEADRTVAPENASLLATQWRALHGLTGPVTAEQARQGVQHRMWPDGKRPLVEFWSLPNLHHAYPIGTRELANGRFVESSAVDATACIMRFLGLD